MECQKCFQIIPLKQGFPKRFPLKNIGDAQTDTVKSLVNRPRPLDVIAKAAEIHQT
jgi:hypothetical protein